MLKNPGCVSLVTPIKQMILRKCGVKSLKLIEKRE